MIGEFLKGKAGIITDTEETAVWTLRQRSQGCVHMPRNVWAPQESGKGMGRGGGTSPHASKRNEPYQHHEFGLLASRAVRQHVCVILSPPVCGHLVRRLQESNAASKGQTE